MKTIASLMQCRSYKYLRPTLDLGKEWQKSEINTILLRQKSNQLLFELIQKTAILRV